MPNDEAETSPNALFVYFRSRIKFGTGFSATFAAFCVTMPVHFKGRSEYDRHYVWRESFRSKGFKPSKEQASKRAGAHSSQKLEQNRTEENTMPVGNQSTAGQMSQKLATTSGPYGEPGLQRKKKVAIHPGQEFHMKHFEPVLQAKKRVDPPFLSKAKTQSEPAMQSKKRVKTDFANTAVEESVNEPALQHKKHGNTRLAKTTALESESNMRPVAIQSKKRVEVPSSDKPVQSEPPIQSKRRTEGPPTTLSNGFYETPGCREDFALLGNQDKFSENVKYRVRTSQAAYRDISPPKQMKLNLKAEKENRFSKTAPAPAPVVDMEQYRQPPTPLAPRKPKEQTQKQQRPWESSEAPAPFQKQGKVQRSPRQPQPESEVRRSKKAQTEEKEVASKKPSNEKPSEPALSQSKQEPAVKKSAIEPAAPNKEALDEIKANKLNLREVKNLDRVEPVKSSLKDKRIMNMNEFAQTNMEKGIADSAPEAPADYALKYKTGIAPPRPNKKTTEYQKQFAWRTGLPASPLLNAEQIMNPEQVVYNSNPQLSPPKKCVIPKVTEYQKQFKAPRLVPVPRDDVETTPRKIAKLQRSKSMEDMSPTDIPTAGSAPVIAPDNRRLTLETNQKQVPEPAPEVPKKKSRHVFSEYRSNFKAPTRFDYLRGSWQGAAPPHIKMQMPGDTTAVPALSNWFSEVLELRRKAAEYRQRALGTHFSREHQLQLMAKQTELWDASSTTTARSTLSALSLESGLNAQRDRGFPAEKAQPSRPGSTGATMASEDDHLGNERLSDSDESPPPKKLAWNDYDDEMPETPSTVTEVLSGEGRMTTPQFRKKAESGSARRHHLDRTTPSVGGALLSSPPSQRKKRSSKKMVSKSVDSVSLGIEDDVEPVSQPVSHKPLAGQKTYTRDAGYLAPTPTFGMPSRDSHFLRDDEAEVDQEMQTNFVHNPAFGRAPVPHRGSLEAINEGFGQTYNKSRPEARDMAWTIDGGMAVPRMDDDDVLSVSMQSIASSCSVASETLERARKRKDEFWGKGGIVTK